MIFAWFRKVLTLKDRAAEGWLTVGLIATVTQWQAVSPDSSANCLGACIGSNFNQSGFYTHLIFTILVALGIGVFLARLHWTNASWLQRQWLFWIGVGMVLTCIGVAGQESWVSQNALSGQLVQYNAVGGFGAWAGLVVGIALMRGGYLIKGGNDVTRLLKLLLFAPTQDEQKREAIPQGSLVEAPMAPPLIP